MNLNNQMAKDLALEVAAKSPCKKRKVGAVITDASGMILSHGYNNNGDIPCEDTYGRTMGKTKHAEVNAINGLRNLSPEERPAIIYVTHEPCDNCAKAIREAGIVHTVIVEEFMKFDSGKLRYGLIPTSTTKALAEVLTYGAKKYKPNNWKTADDTSRYIDALYRHVEAWRNGESNDPESGLSHLSHALANIAFLIHFETSK